MSVILNIETSSRICSVAVTCDGAVEYQLEDTEGMKHAERLAPFVEKAMEEIRRREMHLDAVAVSIGPGSYTGLRIGLATAKGVCTGLNIPLIGVDTLEILAVKAMFRSMDWRGDEILVPMTDARRMEVYTAAYDFALHPLMKPQPLILTAQAYDSLPTGRKVIFVGDATAKGRSVVERENVEWIDGLEPHARDMTALSEKALREGRLLDTAYSVPLYLKEYQAAVPRNKVLKQVQEVRKVEK